MSGGSTNSSLRKALGSIKDTTTISLAKVNSGYKDLDVAIVRATNHVERPAKEKHMRAIFAAISAVQPRADVAYCIHALSRRLSKTHNWAVALKTLIVIHRALREVDPTFQEELINYGRSRNHVLNMGHFKDDSSASAWDYSSWVRCYALYLEERLECFRILKYDVEIERARTKELDTIELLEQLPALQQLLFRAIGCQSEGAAAHNFVIQLALSMVASESMRIYSAISDGTINLVDKFFEMNRQDAIRAFDIYRKAGQQAERLSEFYEVCKNLDVCRGERFIKIEQPPASFLQAMEEYVRDAPRGSTFKKEQVKRIIGEDTPKDILAIEDTPKDVEVEAKEDRPPSPPPPAKDVEAKGVAETPDLLSLDDPAPASVGSDLDQKNGLALAIVPVADPFTTPANASNLENGSTGWELALVTAPSSNEPTKTTGKLAGGLDLLTLDSLYDEGIRRSNQAVSYNPWEGTPTPAMQHDPFYASNGIASAQMPNMNMNAHHQAFMLQQQQQQQMMMMMMGQNQQAFQFQPQGYANPYGSVMPPVQQQQQQQQQAYNPYASGMPPVVQQPYNPYAGHL